MNAIGIKYIAIGEYANEEWGVVLNKGMAEGCGLVDSAGAGAIKSMIDNGRNGLLFASKDIQILAKRLFTLAGDVAYHMQLVHKEQSTISNCWSPVAATDRFGAVSRALLSKSDSSHHNSGPMSLE